MGHTLMVANDGAAGLVMLSQQDFDLVAMGMQMPTMDGLEATRTIRLDELGSARHMPIGAITANAFDNDRRKCFEAGMDGYVVKPVSAKAIVMKWTASWRFLTRRNLKASKNKSCYFEAVARRFVRCWDGKSHFRRVSIASRSNARIVD
jgi:CheY-like chemotaxis protein